jgi:hypothetical protein
VQRRANGRWIARSLAWESGRAKAMAAHGPQHGGNSEAKVEAHDHA